MFKKFFEKFAGKLINRPILKKTAKNIGWLSFDRVFQLIISLTVVLWLVRYLGPESWGAFSYVWAFTGIFTVFIPLGLNSILTKELVEEKINKNKLLGTVFTLQLISSTSLTILSIISSFLFIENVQIKFFVIIGAFINLSMAFRVLSSYFESTLEIKYRVISIDITLFIAAIIKVLFILFNFSLIYFIIIAVIEQFILIGFYIYFYKKLNNYFSKWKFDFKLAKYLLKQSWPLILSNVGVVIYLRIDQLFIGTLLSMYDLGLYSVVVKLVEFGNFIPAIILISTIPILIKNKNKPKLYLHRLTKLYSLMIVLGVIFFVILFIFSDLIITLLYGVEYLPASSVLKIYSFSIIPYFISLVLMRFFVLENLTKYTMYMTLIGAFLNIVLNLILIPIYGIMGAAIATVISYWLLVLSILVFKKTRNNIFIIIKSFNIIKYLKP